MDTSSDFFTIFGFVFVSFSCLTLFEFFCTLLIEKITLHHDNLSRLAYCLLFNKKFLVSSTFFGSTRKSSVCLPQTTLVVDESWVIAKSCLYEFGSSFSIFDFIFSYVTLLFQEESNKNWEKNLKSFRHDSYSIWLFWGFHYRYFNFFLVKKSTEPGLFGNISLVLDMASSCCNCWVQRYWAYKVGEFENNFQKTTKQKQRIAKCAKWSYHQKWNHFQCIDHQLRDKVL